MMSAKTTLPTAAAMSNHALAMLTVMNAAHETSGPKVARYHRFIIQPKANPHAPAMQARPRRVRVAGRTETMKEAIRIGNEVETLYTNGPAGGGGTTRSAKRVLGIVSTLLPRDAVRYAVTYGTT